MRPSTSTCNLVKSLLYSFQGRSNVKSLEHGNLQETHAFDPFQNEFEKTVTTCGLFIHKDFKYLAASPDGVDENALLEIKCPYSASNMTVREGVQSKLIKFCFVNSNN